MLTTAMLLLRSSLFLSLHLAGNTGSFPKPLSAEEEQVYLARCAEGDLDARNVLVERNMRLVAHIIKKYYTQTVDQEDLISIGTIGLIKGISSYKPEKNVRLATYAARCIENATLTQRTPLPKETLRWHPLFHLAPGLYLMSLRPLLDHAETERTGQDTLTTTADKLR